MAVITGTRGRDVITRFAFGGGTVVAARTASGDTVVIHRRRQPIRAVMTILTG